MNEQILQNLQEVPAEPSVVEEPISESELLDLEVKPSTKETSNSWLEKIAKSTAPFAKKMLMIAIATGVIGAMGEKEAFAKGKLLDAPQISSQGYDALEKQKIKLLKESEKKDSESIESEFD